MKFDYDADMGFEERIKKVTNEIRVAYPLIDPEAAKKAATMCFPLDDKPTSDDKFLRYYYLLLYLNPRNYEYDHVFNDLFDLYESGINSEEYNRCVEEIIKYISLERPDFPLLGEV